MVEKDPWTDTLGFTDLGTADRKKTLEEVKRLIENLGDTHPEVFDDEAITPQDYSRELRDAVFSLGGMYRQGHGADNEDVVRDVFLESAEEQGLLTYVDQRGSERIDFKGRLDDTGESFAMDVKGGEGQSIGHLLVPSNTDVLMLWSERNARNTKSPSSRLNEVINRAVRWGFNQSQDPSYMVIRDPPAGAVTNEGSVIPDVVVFPKHFPTPGNPDPQLPVLDDIHFVEILFDVLTGINDIEDDRILKHIWWHDLNFSDGRINKRIWNAFDESIELPTHSIDFSRISDVV
ncbi:hypothetical protein [Halococcus saccharolyticus]|uniref:Uncharacterized protein n=1 Tax=Halococcus saccharolyticus DSM 5350 TaxID=1227455 RepID=M0MRZ8_9EURY|nr:hypothetical protein [Halococcus saccharolyticus]EMA47240.1 hypothetical protein C449_02220 [Halococcus saccharolyticus DSM 5350]